MLSFRRLLFFLVSALAWAAPWRGAEAQNLAPVLDLQCRCFDEQAPRVVQLQWLNPPDVQRQFVLQIVRDAVLIATVPGEQPGAPQSFLDRQDPGPGNHVYEVFVLDPADGRRSPPARCVATCAQVAAVPAAVIAGPSPLQLILPPQGPVEALFDGRGSRDTRGGEALRYLWLVRGESPVEVAAPFASLTRVRFFTPGPYEVVLAVREAPDFKLVGVATQEVFVAPPGQVLGPPRFVPSPQDTLVAIAGRPFSIPLIFEGGPYPSLEVVAGAEAGVAVDAARGRLIWLPPPALAGKVVPVQILAKNDQGNIDVQILIQVLHSGHPLSLFTGPLRKAAGAGDGGGASLGPAPATLDDGSAVQPDLDLQLSLSPGEECAVQLITPDAVDPFGGLLFDPSCAAGSSGVYFTGSAATKLAEEIADDFSIELFVSQVTVPPPLPAYVFSMSEGTTGVNWLIRHDGPLNPGGSTTFAAQVNTGGPVLTVLAAPNAATGLTHLVFVRQGGTHRLYVNGELGATAAGPASLAWDPDYEVFLGNSADETRPFGGRIHMAAVYPNALSPELIAYLSSLGPETPDPGDIPAPVADICPDPREIRRTVEGDGSLSRSLLGGGGGGVGGSLGCPDLLLAPFAWAIDARDAATGLPRGDVTHWFSGDPCHGRIFVGYDARIATRCEVEMTLEVTQVPVRGVVRTAALARRIVVPTHFVRGDSNLDAAFDISDGVSTLLGLFRPGHQLLCVDAADANDDGDLDLSDAIFTFDALFRGGSLPASPFPACGADPSDDRGADRDLGCYLPPDYCPD